MPTNTEAAAVKARRAASRPDQPGPVTPVAVGKGEPARRELLLLHPDEPRIVAESTGSLYGTQAGEEIPGYTIAPEDVFETFVPDRCTTAVTRMRWTKGQHVPTEVFKAHLAAQEAAAKTEEPTA